MKKLHLAPTILAILCSVLQGVSAQGTTSPTSVVNTMPPKVEFVNKTIYTYSNVYTHQFAFSVIPDSTSGGYKFGNQSDSWQLNQMSAKNLSPELKYITVKVINNATVPAAIGTQAELEAIGRIMLASARTQGFDVSTAKVVTSQTNDGLVNLNRYPKANVLVSISTKEGE